MQEWVKNHWNKIEGWQPCIRYQPLHMKVMVVATTRTEGTWCAYCKDVPGMDHGLEWRFALREGDKLSERVALALFPEFEGIPYNG